MTKLDELVSFILSDKLKEIRNFNCYDELVTEAKRLQREQVKNINYDTVLEAVNCAICGKELTEQEKECGNCCDECWLRN